jgi:predicted transcriptional regulator
MGAKSETKTAKPGAKKAPVNPAKTVLEAIGEQLYRERTTQRMTKTKLALESGVSEVTIKAVEDKTLSNVGLEVLCKMAKALGREIVIDLS